MRFRQVFGHNRGGGEPVLAQRVLLDFCDKYPEGSEKKGVKRGGNFSITNYVQNTGSRRVKRQRRQRPKMDYEWFITTMETQRKWSAAKADAKWKELDAVPANFADHGGPEPWTKRLRIPTNLVCGECSESDDEHFEERYAATTGGKPIKHMGAEDRAKLVGEMKMGFTKLESAAPSSQYTRAVPASAVSFTGEASAATGVSALMAVAGVAAGPQSATPSIDASPTKATPLQGKGRDLPSASPTKDIQKKFDEIFDLSSARSSMLSTTVANAKALENKITTRVKEMAKAMAQTTSDRQYTTFFQTAHERLEIGLLWASKMPVQKTLNPKDSPNDGAEVKIVFDYEEMEDFDRNTEVMLLFRFGSNESNLSMNDCLGWSHHPTQLITNHPTQRITNFRFTSRPVGRATTRHGRTRTSLARTRARSIRTQRWSRAVRRRGRPAMRRRRRPAMTRRRRPQQQSPAMRRRWRPQQQRFKLSRRFSPRNGRRGAMPRRVCASLLALWKVARCRWRTWGLCTASMVSWRWSKDANLWQRRLSC